MAPETHRSGILTAGGVLAIISGVLAIIVGVVLVILGILGASGWGLEAIPGGILAIILGLLAIVGGRHALARDRFGWALAGGIASLLCTGLWGIGILALIFIAIKKAEFEPSRRAAEQRNREQVIATRPQTAPASDAPVTRPARWRAPAAPYGELKKRRRWFVRGMYSLFFGGLIWAFMGVFIGTTPRGVSSAGVVSIAVLTAPLIGFGIYCLVRASLMRPRRPEVAEGKESVAEGRGTEQVGTWSLDQIPDTYWSMATSTRPSTWDERLGAWLTRHGWAARIFCGIFALWSVALVAYVAVVQLMSSPTPTAEQMYTGSQPSLMLFVIFSITAIIFGLGAYLDKRGAWWIFYGGVAVAFLAFFVLFGFVAPRYETFVDYSAENIITRENHLLPPGVTQETIPFDEIDVITGEFWDTGVSVFGGERGYRYALFAVTEDGRRIWFTYGPNQHTDTGPPDPEVVELAQEIAAASGAELDLK